MITGVRARARARVRTGVSVRAGVRVRASVMRRLWLLYIHTYMGYGVMRRLGLLLRVWSRSLSQLGSVTVRGQIRVRVRVRVRVRPTKSVSGLGYASGTSD